jgi:hypothetical protein
MGDFLDTATRIQLLKLWRTFIPPQRLIACCWATEEIEETLSHGARPLVTLRNTHTTDSLMSLIASLPPRALVYSHPRYTNISFSARVAAACQERDILPWGCKLTKVDYDEITAIRRCTRESFRLWHGSGRNITRSVEHGASGVVVAPLAALPRTAGRHSIPCLQQTVNDIQHLLDQQSSRLARVDLLKLIAEDPTYVERQKAGGNTPSCPL